MQCASIKVYLRGKYICIQIQINLKLRDKCIGRFCLTIFDSACHGFHFFHFDIYFDIRMSLFHFDIHFDIRISFFILTFGFHFFIFDTAFGSGKIATSCQSLFIFFVNPSYGNLNARQREGYRTICALYCRAQKMHYLLSTRSFFC